MLRFGILAPGAALLLLCASQAGPQTSPASPVHEVDFDRDVLPILGAKCLGCHSGPSPKARLDLLSRKSAIANGRSGEPAVVPGDPDASRLIAVVDGSDAELRMPPRGAPLSDSETKLLRSWITANAKWSPAAESLSGKPWHWAYRAPIAVKPPAVKDAAWSENPIDHFVLATLEREKIEHAPQAARTTLARRLSLTLTGLPPEPESVDAFVADKKPGAVARYIDTLLASPHYGERMARMWLDLARYADTNGYEKDDRRSMWPYRNWVIEAFNQNMPFDRFTLEQLAGDLLPDANLQTRVATGFHRNTMINEEGGVDPEEFRVEAVHDRVLTTGSVFLGSTTGCARCHDHKFDPFTIEDYYGFFGFFNSDLADATVFGPSEQRASGARVSVPPPEQALQYTKLLAQREAALKTIGTATATLEAAQTIWETQRRAASSVWSTLTPSEMSAESGATLSLTADGAITVSGTESDVDTYRLEFVLPAAGLRELRLEVLPDPASESHGVGRSPGGNFVLSEFGAMWISADKKHGGPIAFAQATADFEQRGGNEAWLAPHAIDGNPKTGWAIAGSTNVAHELVLEAAENFGAGAGSILRVTLAQRYGGKHTLACLRLSASNSQDRSLLVPLPMEIATILKKNAAERTSEEAAGLAAQFRATAPALATEQAALAAADAGLAKISTASTLVMQVSGVPRITHVLRKGNFQDPGEEVSPALPAVFGRLPEDLPKNRLGLARWIVSAQDPLFARVFANRVWELDFGRGLVATGDDFGTQGEPPTHPELLDWLACRFIESAYDVKALQRLILSSQTFLQDSRFDATASDRDPANRWLARGPRFRLEAEALRDVALCASGLLVRQLGGPSVFPPQPEGIWTMIYSSDQWMDSVGADRYRRGLYTFARRTAPYPTFAVFDAPSREISCARRSRTNTPLQALTTLNDPQFVEAAVALARRMLSEGGGSEQGTLKRGFAVCVSRSAALEEERTLLELYRAQLATYRADGAACVALLNNGPAGAPPDMDAASVAAWSVVANVLLNLDETLSQE